MHQRSVPVRDCSFVAYHSSSGMQNGHVFENSGSIVGDDDLAVGSLDLSQSISVALILVMFMSNHHLVHSLGSERSSNGIRHGCRNVSYPAQQNDLASSPLAAFIFDSLTSVGLPYSSLISPARFAMF